MLRTINKYITHIRNRKIRFLTRCIVAAGYVTFGVMWWILYGLITLLYHLTCEVIESLFIILEGLAAARQKLRQLHHYLSYFEIALLFIGSIVMMLIMVSLLWILAVIVPAGY